ncbi:MAG: FkbM family methyltransferase [Vicinamibacteria bacterium]|jgi:FkbM family methyltransferase|nr:FkbM family methyltransferase [Vicinamibacteria bacterium]
MISLFRKHILRRILARCVYTIPSGSARGLKRRGDPGLRHLLGMRRPPQPPSPEERFLEALDLKDRTVFDIGGFEGLLTLFFARAVGKSGRVVCFEPNPRSAAVIRDHVAINAFDNIRMLEMALGESAGRLQLVFDSQQPATGSIVPEIQRGLASQGATEATSVEVDALDAVVRHYQLPDPDLIKIDVEGAEYAVLLGMTVTLDRCRPDLHIELHGADERQAAENHPGCRRSLAGPPILDRSCGNWPVDHTGEHTRDYRRPPLLPPGNVRR